MTTIAQRIKALRTQAGLTQEEFGKLFGIVKSTVSLYEGGKSNPDDELKKKIAEHFKISIDFLLGVTDDPTRYRDVNADMISENIDTELNEFLNNNPEFRVAFMDFPSWSDADKQELLNYLQVKKMARESNDTK